MEKYLYETLKQYTGAGSTDDRGEAEQAYPLHMPGHKRRLGSMCDPFAIDITEIDGFDNLHHAEGILKEAQERAARLYESEETHFLVNGSTGGILAAVSAAVTAGRRSGRGGLLMARNCHKAAYHAAYLCDVDPVWLYPRRVSVMQPGEDRPEKHTGSVLRLERGYAEGENPGPSDPGMYLGGRIAPEDVDRALQQHPECASVLIVSPTYDGVISDIGKIARVVHRHRAVLIVDEAHGAQYGLHPDLPLSSVQQGADLVIHSLHKTLPSLTQTALLHVNGPLADRELVHRFLQIYQTSSPSYVLMASMDECIRRVEQHADSWFRDLNTMLDRFYESVQNLRVLRVVRPDDPSRILIFPGTAAQERLSGNMICDILRSVWGLEPEMAVPAYVLALISVGDDEEGLARLSEALNRMDEELFIHRRFDGQRTDFSSGTASNPAEEMLPGTETDASPDRRPERIMTLRQAWDAKRTAVPVEESAGRIAGEPVYLYPPGIPVVVPGEKISLQQAEWMSRCMEAGFELHGMEDQTGQRIQVVEP